MVRFLLPLLVAAPASALAAPVVSWTLANGLRVALQEDHRAPRVAVELSYGVGWRDAPPGYRGLPHLFEHLMFSGSRHAPGDDFWHRLEAAGATGIDGVTRPDDTLFSEVVPSNQLALALWLESDRLGFLLEQLSAATMARERRIIGEEDRARLAPLEADVEERIAGALYPPGHPYRLPPDRAGDLAALRLPEAQWFGERWYRPDDAILTLTGDLDPEEVRPLVTAYFGPLVGHPAPPPAPPPPTVVLRGETRLDFTTSRPDASLRVLWPTPPALTRDSAILDVLAHLLVSGVHGRLVIALQHEQPLAADVEAREEERALGSRFVITASADPGQSPEALLEVVDAELERIRDSDAPPDDLARALREAVEARMAAGQTLEQRGARLAEYWRAWGTPDGFARDRARYEGITADDLRRAASEYLRPDARVVAFVHPTPRVGARP